MKKKFRVGIDLGGTNTHIGLVDADGRIADRCHVPTAQPLDRFTAGVVEGIRSLLKTAADQEGEITGIGVGAPCANANTGCIEGATNLHWGDRVPLARLISDPLGIPVSINNDANAAAAGEHSYGVARGIDNFIYITLGTGVGSGVFCDGHLLSGSRGFAGELGHVVIDPEGPMCGCGRRGCLETRASARGVGFTAQRLMLDTGMPSELRKVTPADLDAKRVSEAAERGDELALEAYREVGRALGRACANFAAFSDPDAIVLFGGVAKAAPLFIPAMREALEEHVLHLYRGRIRILTSSLPDSDAAILGAAAIAPR